MGHTEEKDQLSTNRRTTCLIDVNTINTSNLTGAILKLFTGEPAVREDLKE